MIKNLIFLAAFSLLIGSSVFANSLPDLDKIRKIKLLESSRDDVRKIFAESKPGSSDLSIYTDIFVTDHTTIKVDYSKQAGCDTAVPQMWKIPQYTVIEISVFPDSFIAPADIDANLSLDQLQKGSFTSLENTYASSKAGIKFIALNRDIEEIDFFPSQKQTVPHCEIKGFITISPGGRRFPDRNYPAMMMNVILGAAEISETCANSALSSACSIKVLAVARDYERDVLEYRYAVSGGKITGTGARVVWDLSGVKSGTYTLTADADDGCGFRGSRITKTVIVK